MPVWHDRTATLRKSGELRVVGLVQDQHADRVRLFMQWKQMDWPVLVDSLNRTNARVVPLTWLLDEYGVVRVVNPRPADVTQVVKQSFAAPPGGAPAAAAPPEGSAAEARTEGDRLFLAGDHPSESIAAYERAVVLDATDGANHFRLGVALRRRFESPARRPGDFRRAAAAWTEALERDPGQYIWRRRIQQYGPRLGKPYNFFAWVDQAQAEIDGRGTVPVMLAVKPSGTEIQGPAPDAPPVKIPLLPWATTWPYRNPTVRDATPVVEAEVVTVPTRIAPGRACKVHVVLRAVRSGEARCRPPARVWMVRPEGWGGDLIVDRASPTFASSPAAACQTFEFELRAPRDAKPGPVKLPVRVAYNAVQKAGGKSQILFQDLEAEVTVRPAPPQKPRR